MVVNEIDAAFARGATYEEKLALFIKYTKNAALIHSLKNRKDRETKRLLDFELKRLRWKPGIALVKKVKPVISPEEEVKETSPIILRVKNKFIGDDLSDDKRLYPLVIEQAIQDRQRAINRREKAGRALVEKADSLTKGSRAELIRIQKEEHKIVMATTAVINTWKKTGVLPTKDKVIPEIPADKLVELEKEWTASLRSLSRAKKSLAGWSKKGKSGKVDEYKEKILKLNQRLDELSLILGKKRRGNEANSEIK